MKKAVEPVTIDLMRRQQGFHDAGTYDTGRGEAVFCQQYARPIEHNLYSTTLKSVSGTSMAIQTTNFTHPPSP